MTKIRRFIALLLLSFLAGCSDQVCIDADDFGFASVKVPAYYARDKIFGSGASQYTNWIDSGLTLSGSNLLMIVKYWDGQHNINTSAELSAWCPWLGPADSPPSLFTLCSLLDECQFANNDTCTADSMGRANIVNAPCLLKRGVGLYFVATPLGNPTFSPNSSLAVNIEPQNVAPAGSIIKHMNSNIKDINGLDVTFYDLQIEPEDTRIINGQVRSTTSSYVATGGYLSTLSNLDAAKLSGGKLYFKIIDTYYTDNSGQYIVTVKTGVNTTDFDIIRYVVQLIQNFFFGGISNVSLGDISSTLIEPGIIKIMFNNVITNSSYRLAVSSALTAALMFYAFNFVIGNVKVTSLDLIIRVIKIIIVSQLLTSATAWDFFYDNIFTYFINGSSAIKSIIESSGAAGPGSSSILSFMTSPNVIIKLFALPLMSWPTFGWSMIYILLYMVTLFFMFIVVCYAGVVTVLAIIMMGLLVVLAPIFLCFMLFKTTSNLFDTWLKQLTVYALQSVVTVAGVTIMSIIIKHQIYQTLGFRVCKNFFFLPVIQNASSSTLDGSGKVTPLSGNDGRSANLYYWQPVYAVANPSAGTGEQMRSILLPEAHFANNVNPTVAGGSNPKDYSLSGNTVNTNNPVSGNSVNGTFCLPYQCQGMRYPSFPFLDPGNSADLKMLEGFWSGNFTPLPSILMLILSCLLLGYFIYTADSIGDSIVGGSSFITGAAQAITAQFAKDTVDYGGAAGGKVGKAAGYAIKGVAKLAGMGARLATGRKAGTTATANDDVSGQQNSDEGTPKTEDPSVEFVDDKSKTSNVEENSKDKQSSNSDKQGSNSDKQSSNSDKQGSNSDKQSSNSDKQGSNSDKQGSNSDKQSSNSDKQSSNSDKQSSNSDKQGSNSDKQGSNSDKQSSNSDKQSSNSDSSANKNSGSNQGESAKSSSSTTETGGNKGPQVAVKSSGPKGGSGDTGGFTPPSSSPPDS